jgi:hypothetical protein
MRKPAKEAEKIVDLVEIKKTNNRERKRVVLRCSGKTIEGEFIGGIWKDKRDEVHCPECHRTRTEVSFGIDDAGFRDGRFSKSGGELVSMLGTLNLKCKDCRKHFTYELYGNLSFTLIESATFEERTKALKEMKDGINERRAT